MFKKIVIADNCAKYADIAFNNTISLSSSTLILGAIFFAFQIYGDFSGYSDIAIGTSRLFGFNLMKNFAFPYFSRDIAEFWRRWHISLSTWFRDYLYIPIGGNKGNFCVKIRNIFIIFIISGFWHGANWTFIIWGLLNAIYFLPLLLFNRHRNNLDIVAKDKAFPSIKDVMSIFITFILTIFGWIFFRASNLKHAFNYISNIFSNTILSVPDFPLGSKLRVVITIGCVIFLLLIEWVGRKEEYGIEKIFLKQNTILRHGLYYIILFMIIVFGSFDKDYFIYFQF